MNGSAPLTLAFSITSSMLAYLYALTLATTPILTGIKLEITNEGLHLTGSDADITIQTFIPVEEDGKQIINVSNVGSIVLQARMFNEIVRKLPTNEVEIEVTNGFATNIRSGKSEFHLIGQDSAEYPSLPELSADQQFAIPADLLKAIIRETVFAVATSESRPVLTGVNWNIQGDELICVATDSHRLARRKVKLKNLQYFGKQTDKISVIPAIPH